MGRIKMFGLEKETYERQCLTITWIPIKFSIKKEHDRNSQIL